MEHEPVKEQRVEAVERALSLLEAFADGAERLSLAELTKASGLYRSTILRLAATLQRAGYLHRDADGWFRLGPSLFRLGSLYQNAFHLADYVRPVLAELSAATEETAAFYVREVDRRICLYRHHAPRLMRHHLEEGAVLPLDRGAGGRVLRAFSDDDPADRDIRRDGFYFSDGERDPETSACSVPVLGPGDTLVGALAVVGSRRRLEGPQLDQVRTLLATHAHRLEDAIGRRRVREVARRVDDGGW